MYKKTRVIPNLKEMVAKVEEIRIREGYPIGMVCREIGITYLTYKRILTSDYCTYRVLKGLKDFLSAHELKEVHDTTRGN